MPSITQRLPLLTRQHLHQDWCRIHRPCSCDRVRDGNLPSPPQRPLRWLDEAPAPVVEHSSPTLAVVHLMEQIVVPVPQTTDKIAEANQCASRGHTRRSSHSRPFHTRSATSETLVEQIVRPLSEAVRGHVRPRKLGVHRGVDPHGTALPCSAALPAHDPREEQDLRQIAKCVPWFFDPTPSGAATAAHCGMGFGSDCLNNVTLDRCVLVATPSA